MSTKGKIEGKWKKNRERSRFKQSNIQLFSHGAFPGLEWMIFSCKRGISHHASPPDWCSADLKNSRRSHANGHTISHKSFYFSFLCAKDCLHPFSIVKDQLKGKCRVFYVAIYFEKVVLSKLASTDFILISESYTEIRTAPDSRKGLRSPFSDQKWFQEVWNFTNALLM